MSSVPLYIAIHDWWHIEPVRSSLRQEKMANRPH